MKKFLLFCICAFPLFSIAQLPAGSIAQYPLDNSAADISGNSYNGSLNAATPALNRFGETGKAIELVAGSSTGQLPGTLQTAISGNFSMAFWFNTSMTANAGPQWYHGNAIIDAEVCGATTDWGVALIDGGKIAFGAGTNDRTAKSPLNYNDGAWHFVTTTRNQVTGEMKLYVNGSEVASANGDPGSLIAPAFIGLGRNPCDATAKYTGRLDDIFFYNRVLANTEVSDLYNYSTLITLPLTWLKFTGVEKNNRVVLNWKVANLFRGESFQVESSRDGQYFTFSGAVDVKAGVSDYSYESPNKVSEGITYFRIRQVDNDRKFSYSNVISVRTGLEKRGVSIVRNPASSVLSINNPGQAIIHQLVIADATGRRLIVQQVQSSNTFLNVDISKLQPGQYFVSVLTDSNTSVIPFLKLQ